MAQRLIAIALAAVALIVAPDASLAVDAQVPVLDSGAQPPPPAVDQPGGARRLPGTVAVCEDPSKQRCWLARTAADCGEAPAALFRLVIDEPGRPDVAHALAACRDAVRP